MALTLINRRQGGLQPGAMVAVDYTPWGVFVGTIEATVRKDGRGEVYRVNLEPIGPKEIHSSYILGEVKIEGGKD